MVQKCFANQSWNNSACKMIPTFPTKDINKFFTRTKIWWLNSFLYNRAIHYPIDYYNYNIFFNSLGSFWVQNPKKFGSFHGLFGCCPRIGDDFSGHDHFNWLSRMHECNMGDGGNMRGNNHAQELNTLNCLWLIPRHLESQVQTVSEGISLIVLAEHYKVLIIT